MVAIIVTYTIGGIALFHFSKDTMDNKTDVLEVTKPPNQQLEQKMKTYTMITHI